MTVQLAETSPECGKDNEFSATVSRRAALSGALAVPMALAVPISAQAMADPAIVAHAHWRAVFESCPGDQHGEAVERRWLAALREAERALIEVQPRSPRGWAAKLDLASDLHGGDDTDEVEQLLRQAIAMLERAA